MVKEYRPYQVPVEIAGELATPTRLDECYVLSGGAYGRDEEAFIEDWRVVCLSDAPAPARTIAQILEYVSLLHYALRRRDEEASRRFVREIRAHSELLAEDVSHLFALMVEDDNL